MQSLSFSPAHPALPAPHTAPDTHPRDAYRTPPRRPTPRNYSPHRKLDNSPPLHPSDSPLAAKLAAMRLCF